MSESYGLAIIEDCAQAIGAEHEGERVGSIGDYGCFSFFPSKNLGGFGDGGMVTTREPTDRLKSLRMHGESTKYHHDEIGGNFRLDALQAAVLSVKLRHLDNWTQERQANAARYDFDLLAADVAGHITLPQTARATTRHVWNQYTIRVHNGRRDALMQHLQTKGIGCAVYYPLPLHLQKCFAYLGYRAGDYPQAELAAQEVLSIPIFPELTKQEQMGIIKEIYSFSE